MNKDVCKVIDDLVDRVYNTAKSKGWHDSPTTLVERLCLVHSELSEGLEELRNGQDPTAVYFEHGGDNTKKPCGFPIEMADVVIRVMDLCRYHGVDLRGALAMKMDYNETRQWRHGGKKI